MGLITANDALDFLSKSAPRAWVKRMLLWMIFNAELEAYFLEGRSIATVKLFSIALRALGAEAFGERREELIRKNFDAEMAEKLISADAMDDYEEVAYEWNLKEGPQQVSCGYFVYATNIDWEEGTVQATIHYSTKRDDTLFWDADNLLVSDLEDPDYEVTLKGLCFDRDKIEILQPSIDLSPSPQDRKKERPRIGRPRTWDWDGAITHLLTIAQKPDGLPVGPGAQAQIERLVADWFIAGAGNGPSVSQVRQHVTNIVRAIKASKGS